MFLPAAGSSHELLTDASSIAEIDGHHASRNDGARGKAQAERPRGGLPQRRPRRRDPLAAAGEAASCAASGVSPEHGAIYLISGPIHRRRLAHTDAASGFFYHARAAGDSRATKNLSFAAPCPPEGEVDASTKAFRSCLTGPR
jgi:hypothetical protein